MIGSTKILLVIFFVGGIRSISYRRLHFEESENCKYFIFDILIWSASRGWQSGFANRFVALATSCWLESALVLAGGGASSLLV